MAELAVALFNLAMAFLAALALVPLAIAKLLVSLWREL